MRFRRALISIIFAVTLFFCPPSADARENWLRVQTEHFEFVGNASKEEILEIARNLERFRLVFRRSMKLFDFDPAVPTRVIVFRDEESFERFKPINKEGRPTEWTAGLFQAGEAVNYISLSVKSDRTKTFRTIYHEYTHNLIDGAIGRTNVPPWLNEGLAEYFETLRFEDEKLVLGGVSADHLKLLRQKKLLPLKDFFETDYYSLQVKDRDSAVHFYAQSWLLAHFLLHFENTNFENENGGRFFRFVDLIKNGTHWSKAFREAFQKDHLSVENDLAAYLARKNFGIFKLVPGDQPVLDQRLSVESITQPAAEAVLGDMLYHLNRAEDAAETLIKVLEVDPDSVAANISLGLVRIRQKRFSEAAKLLDKAVRLNERNFLGQYQYAYALSREGMSEFGFVSGYDYARAERMRDHLKKAIALNPRFAQSYNLYAFISVVRNEELDLAMRYLDEAIRLVPGNQWFQIRRAELFMRLEKFADAREIARKIYSSATDDELRVYALNRIQLINSLEAQMEDLKNYKKREKREFPDKPLTDEEFARLRELSILEGINQALRKPLAGEKRLLGFITKIICRNDGVDYHISTGGELIRLSSQNFSDLAIVSYARETSNFQIGCDTVKKETFAVVTFKETPSGSSSGQIVSVEFVPRNFKLLDPLLLQN